RCLLNYAQIVGIEKLPGLVRLSGKKVLRRLEELTRPMFPSREHVATYMWSYTLTCPQCSYEFSLAKRPWLSRRNAKLTGMTLRKGERKDLVEIAEELDDHEHPS